MSQSFTLFWLMLKASLLSSGGLGNLASLHQDLLVRGWATDHTFAEAIAIGQLSPGPTGLWVVALGFLVTGYLGSAAAVVAILIPPLLVIPVGLLYSRYSGIHLVNGFVSGLALAVTGSVPVVVLKLAASYGFDWLSVALVGASVVLISSRRLPVAAVLALGALAGAIAYR